MRFLRYISIMNASEGNGDATMVNFNVTSCKLGAFLHCSGKTADLATDKEVDEIAKRIRSMVDRAAIEAKAAIRAERAKGAYD